MSEYVIGVDIGGTKSHLALFDTEGNLIDFGRWGRLNYETLPGLYAQFEEEIGQFVSRVILRAGISLEQVSCSVLGVGGVDTKKQHKTISEILSGLGFKKFTLVNDAFLGIFAGNRNKIGICAINGSGCTLAGINKEGRMLQIGGVGAVSADMGGGGYMGERVVSAVYSELFRKGEATLMTGLLFEELSITSKYDYIERMHEKQSDGSFDINKCGKLVFEAVRQNDHVASGILLEMAGNYANGISCMIEELKFPLDEELPVVFAGSVFVKGEHPLLLDSIKAKVSGDNQGWNITYKLLDMPNVAGAVIWALDSIDNDNKDDKNTNYDKVCKQLRDV
jgi:N-acetylglucosamine kinase-like BadF-type ATPase